MGRKLTDWVWPIKEWTKLPSEAFQTHILQSAKHKYIKHHNIVETYIINPKRFNGHDMLVCHKGAFLGLTIHELQPYFLGLQNKIPNCFNKLGHLPKLFKLEL